MQSRLNFIDVARSYAIGMALFSHAMIDFGGWNQSVSVDQFRALTRTATPLFLFMFGMMMELVYVRYAQRDGLRQITPRLIQRSVQCYLGLVLTIIAGIIGGYVFKRQGIYAMFFSADCHFGLILRLYAVVLLLMPLLIKARLRWGIRSMIGLLALVWLADYLVLDNMTINTTARPWVQWSGIFLGEGKEPMGPSIWHSFSFILTGMILGNSLTRWKVVGLQPFYQLGFYILLSSAAVLSFLIYEEGWESVLYKFITYAEYRQSNHIAYYLIGVSSSIAILMLLSGVIPQQNLPAWTQYPLEFGKSSLFSFCLGNVCLSLIPESTIAFSNVWMAIGFSLAFVFLIMMLVNARVYILKTALIPQNFVKLIN